MSARSNRREEALSWTRAGPLVPSEEGVAPAEGLAALAPARATVLELLQQQPVSHQKLATAVDGDVALTVVVLRLANRPQVKRGRVASVSDAVELLDLEELETAVRDIPTFDFFEATTREAVGYPFNIHALAVRRTAEQLALATGWAAPGEVRAAALLHDVGKLFIGGGRLRHGEHGRTPEERVRAERRRVGWDHAELGGGLARRWKLPDRVAEAIELHHSDASRGAAAIVRLADMLTHYQERRPVDKTKIVALSAAIGLERNALSSLMHRMASHPTASHESSREDRPCVLTHRESQILRRLRDGKVYKEIALELELSVNTVRVHIHNAYRKLGATDRAQAVLTATRRGWI